LVEKAKSLLEINLKEVIERVEQRYGVRLPRKIVMVDYGEDVGDLFIKFSHEKIVDGEITQDGITIMHYGENNKLVAIEITDITKL